MPKTQRRRWRSMHPMDFSFVSLSRNVRLCDRSRGTGTLARVPLLCSSARLSDSNLSGSRSCQRALVASLRQTTGLFFVLSLRHIYPTAAAGRSGGCEKLDRFFLLSLNVPFAITFLLQRRVVPRCPRQRLRAAHQLRASNNASHQ